MAYPVNEIFYSLQGEGWFTGSAAVFVRFSGCNMKCSFCDTDHSASTMMEAREIVDKVLGFPARHVILTGGEPAMRVDSLLIDMLHAEGCFIQIETNGSLPVSDEIDWITCSPKGDYSVRLPRVDELKIVFQAQDVEAIASRVPATHLFLQPCSGANIPETVDYILTHPWWRLSLQTHKLIDIP